MKRILYISVGLVLFGCSKITPVAPDSNEVLAEPIADLTSAQLALHIAGDEEFARVFAAADGLGPIFVQNACESCHVGDGKGNPAHNLTRFGKYDSTQTWSSVLSMGGPQLQHRSIQNYTPESLPAGVQSSEFVAPNVTGLGYLAAVLDETILLNVDPNDADGDGISGVVNYISAPDWLTPDSRYHDIQPNGKYIGRFGRKAAAIDLTMQTVGAYKQDMGITSDFDPVDPINPYSSIFADDNVADPEIPASTVNKVVFYLHTLEQPRRRNENDDDVIKGEALLGSIGCTDCHFSELETGESEVSALNKVKFSAYTDMLLHDMGADLDDNYTEGEVETYEWRTLPLWGLGLQAESQGGAMYLMHDGRATSFDDAIQLHGGESTASKTNYNALSELEKSQLIKFLESL